MIEDWANQDRFDWAAWNAEAAILVYDRPLHKRLLELHDLRALDFGAPGSYHSIAATEDRVVLVGEFGIGAPVAAVIAEALIASGVKHIVSLGTAGGIQTDLHAGQIISVQGAIKGKIEGNWSNRLACSGQEVTISVKVNISGEVTAVQVVGDSGDDACRRSAENAVYKASPLPFPDNPRFFKWLDQEFQIIFKPDI